MEIPMELMSRISKIESKDMSDNRKLIAKKCKDANYMIEVVSKKLKNIYDNHSTKEK